jgi:SAM-dependent methyltransferase
MRSFAERSSETELMDTEAVDFEEFRACLKNLALVNTLTLTHHPLMAWLGRATRQFKPGDRVSVVDIGYGYGEVLRAVHDWCLAKGFEPDLTGIDLNPWSAASARAATPTGTRIDYRTGDVFAYEPSRPVQFVVSSQFTHHLGDSDVVRFIAWMERTATHGWFICDLHRHPVPYYVFKALARLARWHRFIQHDGPVSIARSFRRAEWRRLAAAAGLAPDAITVAWHIPFRFSVERFR